MCLGIQLWTDCRELRELQMLSALSAPLASPLYSANWPEVKNSLGWPGRDWFTDFMYKVNTLSGGELNSLHHILTSYLPPDLSCYFNPAIFNTTACFCLTGVTQVKRWSNYPNMWFIFKKKKKNDVRHFRHFFGFQKYRQAYLEESNYSCSPPKELKIIRLF